MLLEHFGRGANPKIIVQQEPLRTAGKGAPDFKVTVSGSILGYVENKQIGADIEAVLKSDQIRRYRTLSDNILITDYLHFVWIDAKGAKHRESLCFPEDVSNPRFKIRPERQAAIEAILAGFFSSPPQGIHRAEQLALALATRSQFLRDFLSEELVRQEIQHKEGRLYGLYQVFRRQVFHELSLAEFADAFAQMLAYGLFLARLNSGQDVVTLKNARQFVPGSFKLIRELVQFVEELESSDYATIRWVVDEILSIVNGLDLAAIREDLSFKNRKAISRKVRAANEDEHRLFERDPFIYFYEHYLSKYDSKMRKGRGVYYTPPPIVNFIVRAIDDILKGTFNIKLGLADHKRVTVLDFACGTGTFLLEILERIFENIGGSDLGKARQLVREHMLKNIYGFEYLIAPYTIAHLKLSQYLEDRGHKLSGEDRMQIFLTNTLEPVEPQDNFLLPALSDETRRAQTVKNKPILVITGNPPYSGHSKNKGAWITSAIDGYKHTVETDKDGNERIKPLGEKNPKWLNDDYVKFIRFAQLKMDAVDEGVVGIITNHSWLENPTFRGMRQSLSRSFDQIFILDLHGSSKPKEVAPDGVLDENVFDIQKGVAISLFVKKSGVEKGIWRGDWWGKRLEKYSWAVERVKAKSFPTKIVPGGEFLTFKESNASLRTEYEVHPKIGEIFLTSVLGFQTHRDHFAIAFERTQLEERVSDLSDPDKSIDSLKAKYRLKDNRDWSVQGSREKLLSAEGVEKRISLCSYRPFDNRWCFFGEEFMDYPRRELLDHVWGRENISLAVSRQVGSGEWRHAFVAQFPANDCLVSNRTKEANQVFPLYVYPTREGSHRSHPELFSDTDPFGGNARRENVSPSFRRWIDAKYGRRFSPEQLFGYIYAILQASAYRAKYAELLRIDFPRIAFAARESDFEKLAALGWELAQAHLLKEVQSLNLGVYRGVGGNTVETVQYSAEELSVRINATQRFAPISQAVWNYQVGSYRVLEKYIKDRSGRELSLDEINAVENIANAIEFSLDSVSKIDAIYDEAFSVKP
jgi:predicted helicase